MRLHPEELREENGGNTQGKCKSYIQRFPQVLAKTVSIYEVNSLDLEALENDFILTLLHIKASQKNMLKLILRFYHPYSSSYEQLNLGRPF